MAKLTSSLASPTSCASSSSSSYSSSSSSSTSSSSSASSRKSSLLSEQSLSIKSSSAIDRRKRLAANARERKRMHLLNKAYDELRRRLKDAENKSKYDVLVQAKEYIQALATICEKFDQQDSQQGQQTILIANGPSSNEENPSQASAQSNLKIETTPMDMTYNQIKLEHYHHQDVKQQFVRQITPIQLYQQHSQTMSYT